DGADSDTAEAIAGMEVRRRARALDATAAWVRDGGEVRKLAERGALQWEAAWQENLRPDSVRIGGETDRIGGSVPVYFKTLSGKRGEYARQLWLHDDSGQKTGHKPPHTGAALSVSSGVKLRRRCANVNANALRIHPDKGPHWLSRDWPTRRMVDAKHDEL